MTAYYQVAIIDRLGKATTSRAAVLKATLSRAVSALGLIPDRELRFFSAEEISAVDLRYPVVGVYLGASNPSRVAVSALEKLCKNGSFVLPVASSQALFLKQIPKILRPINAAFFSEDDSKLSRIAMRLLEELRLLRNKRRIFISYKRSESRSVAVQLYHALDERSFDVFLDTHSIQRGKEFQPMLWDSMGDTDVLILLDTPGAFTSHWVEQEISRAHALGLGLLQLIWPGHSRDLGSYLCDSIYLETKDFLETGNGKDARLRGPLVKKIVGKTEELRSRALAARRNRVVTELCRIANELGYRSVDEVAGPVLMRSTGIKPVIAFPVIGHPDSHLVQETFSDCMKRKAFRKASQCLVYDPLGMWAGKHSHLSWLNDYLPIQTVPITGVASWLKRRK
ncbi:MAG: toll/interleukin-1 receptor domain-containing protein [Bdellovibrionales bacterium]|nr:toll/interleukin-1 receptor domain-containing protein [Bdellovibrionales bacterium]